MAKKIDDEIPIPKEDPATQQQPTIQVKIAVAGGCGAAVCPSPMPTLGPSLSLLSACLPSQVEI